MFSRPNLFIKILAIFITLNFILFLYFQENIMFNTYKVYNLYNACKTDLHKTLSSKATQQDLKLDKLYGQLPLSFEENFGQAKSNIKFISHGFDYNLLLENNKVTLVPNHKNSSSLSLEFLGSKDDIKVIGNNQLETKTNYLIGQDQTKWQKEINNFSKVTYKELYKGIDAVFYGNKKHLEYDLIVAPNVDPDLIKLKFEGLKQTPTVNKEGDLLLEIAGGIINQHKPFIYQEIAGNKIPVSGSYKIIQSNLVGFTLGEYDKTQALVIDPEISYSSYLGGSLTDQANSIAIDTAGNAYIVGSTSSINFPTSSALQRNFGGGPFDVFVAKFNPTATSLIYATYFGGSSLDEGFDIAVDSAGSAYITGQTLSTNFPNQNAIQSTKGGGVFDAFITKLNPAGNNLIYSSYLGGNDDDQAFSLALNKEGNAFIAGTTSSRNFPGAQSTSLSGVSDGFITQINAQGNQIVYSRYLGGNDEEDCSAIIVDTSNNAYVIGDTFSANFPIQSAFQSSFSGGQDTFLAKLNPNGSILYSTYFGGSNNDAGVDVAIDSDNNAYLVGTTNSTNILTKSSFQRNLAGGTDVFLAKIDPTGSNLIYSTYLGGKADDTASAIGLDPLGNVYLTGSSFSTDFPVTKALQDKNKGTNDIFVSVLDPSASNFIYSTYLGGKTQDVALAMVVDKEGSVYLTGSSSSTDFPTTNAFQRLSGGNSDAFITKITNDISAPPSPDFSLAISPNTQTLSAGNSTSFTINSRAINGFDQPITLMASSSPQNSALTTSFSTNTVMPGNNTTLTVSAGSNISSGIFTINIMAVSGQITRTLTATVNVVIPDFSLTIEPANQAVMIGNRATFLVNIKAVNGFNKAVSLATSFSPNDGNLTSNFSNPTVTPDGTTTLNIDTTNNTQVRTFTITVTGFSDQIVKTTTSTLTVVSSLPPPDFTLSLNSSQLNVSRKDSGTIGININRVGNFTGNVTVKTPDTKAMKIIFTPSTQSTFGTNVSVNFKIKKKAPKGSQVLSFIGQDDSGRTRMTTLTLIVQ